MPKHKDISKFKHPNSRKTSALSKKIIRNTNKLKRKQQRGGTIEKRILIDKLQWFKDNIEPTISTQYGVEAHITIIRKYLKRFNSKEIQDLMKNWNKLV